MKPDLAQKGPNALEGSGNEMLTWGANRGGSEKPETPSGQWTLMESKHQDVIP